MPFKVHIENFQSIREADLEVDGLTIITGQNNSGKSAIMRAIRAVFQNRRGSNFIHEGQDHCTVRIDFDDGQHVQWHKYGKRPTRGKNKGILGSIKTDYLVNGEEFKGVSHDVPEQVTALGVKAITLGNDAVWPQIARQVEDVFFLIDRPGSNIAEAVADVERVAVLNHAIRSCDKDLRSNKSKLKVRKEDAKNAEHRLAAFEGLDPVLEVVTGVEDLHAKAQKAHNGLTWATKMRDRLTQASDTVERYAGIENVEVPSDLQPARDALGELDQARGLKKRRDEAQEALSVYEGFSDVALPGDEDIKKGDKLVNALQLAIGLRKRLESAQGVVDSMDISAVPEVNIDTSKMDKLVKGIDLAKRLEKQLASAQKGADKTSAELDAATKELEAAQTELDEFEVNFPKCPECGQYQMESHA